MNIIILLVQLGQFSLQESIEDTIGGFIGIILVVDCLSCKGRLLIKLSLHIPIPSRSRIIKYILAESDIFVRIKCSLLLINIFC